MALVPFFKKEGIEKILDLGCGTGRHVVYLAQQGFYVVGIDFSADALAEAKLVTQGQINVNLVQARISEIPYDDNFFDAIICSHVIQHALKSERDKAFSEMNRTLKQRGLIFLRVPSRNHAAYGTGREIEPNTYIEIPGLPDGDTLIIISLIQN